MSNNNIQYLLETMAFQMREKALNGAMDARAALDLIADYLDGNGRYPHTECMSLAAHADTIENAFVGDWSHWYSDERHQYPALCPALRFLSHTFGRIDFETDTLYRAVLMATREEVARVIGHYEDPM